MDNSKVKICRLFFLTFLVASTLLAMALVMKWQDLKREHVSEQSNMVKLLRSSLTAKFIQYDVLLDLLGHKLIDDKTYLNKEKSKSIFRDILANDSNVAGFGLADTQGNFIVVNRDVDESTLPNLLEQQHIAQSFRSALQSESIVIGRNYNNKEVGAWVVPFRKSIRTPEGKVVYVMTFGLYLSKFTEQLYDNLQIIDERRIALIRDEDRYHQLLLSNFRDTKTLYTKPIPLATYQKFVGPIIETSGVSINEVKRSGHVYEISSVDEKGHDVLYSVTYDNRFKLWIAVDTHYNVIIKKYLKAIYLVLLIFAIGMALLLVAFCSIAKKEQEKHKVREYESLHDPLTRLVNRQYFNTFVKKATDDKKPFSLLVIALDSFKKVNSVFGYSIGDKVLVEVANRLVNMSPPFKEIIRYSGDEFIVVANNIEYEKIFHIAKDIRDCLSQEYLIDGYSISIDSRIGVSRFPLNSTNDKDLLRSAEVATEDAKLRGERITIYKSGIDDLYIRNYKIEDSLSSAVKHHELSLAYQPQFNAKGELIGIESLARWISPELGFVSPLEFIQVAEKNNLIFELGNHLIDKTFLEVTPILLENKEISLSINISVKQFMQHNFIDILAQLLMKHNFPPHKLIIEVTESLFIDNLSYVYDSLKQLKEMGINISLDDFGTGYSSLSLLKSLPIDEIKIDKSFVDDIVDDPKARHMLASIISVSSAFGFTIVAEGVESLAQKELLESLGADIYQGYFFAKPMSLEELHALTK